MRVLTTDLDRTLIFSARSLKAPINEAICVEQLDDHAISFMNGRTLDLFREVVKKHLLIPVTSRSTSQYARIQWPITPRYAIVANGGIILQHGATDEVWAAHIASQMRTVEQVGVIAQQFLQTFQYELYDHLYFVCRHEDLTVPPHIITALKQHGWTVYQNGRKLYVMPQFLTKEAAVDYLLDKLTYDTHFAAGDSIMDVGMLQLATYRFAPAASEAAEILPEAATAERGIAFVEQVLMQLLQ